MTVLKDLINITVSRETATVQRASFAIPCFIASHVAFSERAKEYNSVTEVADDFASTSKVYIAAQKYFAQDQGLQTLVVGRRHVPGVVITPTVVNSATYSFNLEGEAITYTADSSATAAEIVAGLQAAITSAGVTGLTVGGTTTLTIAPSVAGTGYAIKGLSSNLSLANDTVTETWADAITAVRNLNDTWFVMSADSHLDADVLAIAAAIETLDKMYVFSSQASAVKTSSTSDIFSQVKALNYDNTFYIWNGSADTNFIECAWAGYFAAQQPGSTHWCYKTLSGITADALTSSEANYIKNKNGSTYEANIGGRDVVIGGKVSVGEWIDVLVFCFWLKARIAEGIWFQQVNSKKISYTSKGAAVLEAEIRRVLAEGIQVGGLADSPAPSVTIPNILNISSAVRATRVLPDITFTARLAGAIMYTTISGTVTA